MIDNGPNLTELYRKYRPRKWKNVLGQEEAVRILFEKVKQNKVPHGVGFFGPSGTGKTTLAWILAEKIGCSKADFTEINMADTRGIDTIREINSRITLSPTNGTCRVWVLDEVHQASSDAQSALLKALEKCPSHVYFFLCTTHPNKLLDTVRNRLELKVHLKSVSKEHIITLVKGVAILEGTTISDQVALKIAETAEGSARDALGLLSQALAFTTEEDRLKAVVRHDLQGTAWELVEAFVYKRRPWKEIAEILKRVEGENAEGLRRFILACARKELFKDGNAAEKGYAIICAFEGSMLPDGMAGHASIARACWELSKKK